MKVRLQRTSRRQMKRFSVQQFFKNAAEVWAKQITKLHNETATKI